MSENKTFDEKIKFWKNIVANNNKYAETNEPSKKPDVFIKQNTPNKETAELINKKPKKKKTKKVDPREFTTVDDCLQKPQNDKPIQEPVEETSEELTRQLIEMFKEKK